MAVIIVQAFHITWTAYGTWLSGDKRGWVSKKRGQQKPDTKLEAEMRARMAQGAVCFEPEQRVVIEDAIRTLCAERGWHLHAVNARPMHVHVVVSSPLSGERTRNDLKARCSARLSDHAGLSQPVAKKAGRRRWFTEGGDIEDVDTEEYLQNAIEYVLFGQD